MSQVAKNASLKTAKPADVGVSYSYKSIQANKSDSWKSMTTGLIHAKPRPLDKAYKQVSLAYTRLNHCGYG